MIRLVAALVPVLLLAGCAAVPDFARSYDVPPPPVGYATFDPEVVPTIAIVGDSTTAWDYDVGGDPTLSWVSTASSSVQVVCGWAESGATVSEMLEAATPCPQARFLVLMGGTNDIPGDTPIPERLAAIDGIAATVGAQYTVLVHVAPLDKYAPRVLEWNAALTAHAQQRGWVLVDPWAPVRDPSGAFLPGTAIWDNVHPTPETAVLVGTNMARALTLANTFLP
ncbi:MAG TPA: SGNH/GDSL hydrolase family protein [Pseudolysinimonas sp.]|nr:SGNH/GDSL hydrolase family protein [Pseudolysinimonas sp.]